MFNRLNPMSLLLMGQGYPPGVLVAVVLHGLLLYLLLDKELGPRDTVDLQKPTHINAMTIQENPQRLRRLDQEQQRQAEEAARRAAQAEAERQRAAEAARQQETERQAEEQRRQQELVRQRAQEEAAATQRAREQEEARQQAARREQEAREQAAREQAAREAEARQAAAQRQAEEQAAADNASIQSYMAVIQDAVWRNWSIPPSARNGMTAVLNVRLVPTGEVVSVSVLTSSGDPIFDRSAEQAVLRTGRFPELQQMPNRLFEREFRSFNLLFRPEDLLR